MLYAIQNENDEFVRRFVRCVVEGHQAVLVLFHYVGLCFEKGPCDVGGVSVLYGRGEQGGATIRTATCPVNRISCVDHFLEAACSAQSFEEHVKAAMILFRVVTLVHARR
mgnify:CR=1 FL=1